MLEKYHYNHLIINALNLIKIKRNLKISDIAERSGYKTKDLYNIKSHGRIAKEEDYYKIKEGFPEMGFKDLEKVEETDVEYSYKSNPYKKLSEALEENNEYLKEKVKKLELENSLLKAEIYELKNL